MKYPKTLELFLDYTKSISAGSIIASLVGFILQEKKASWVLLVFGIVFFTIALSIAIFYDKRRQK